MDTFILKNTLPDSIATEVMFYIASERTRNADIVKFCASQDIEEEKRAKILASAKKVLRGMKKQGRIQFFACLEDFTQSTTEAQYLKNKYPDAEFFDPDEADFILVRI